MNPPRVTPACAAHPFLAARWVAVVLLGSGAVASFAQSSTDTQPRANLPRASALAGDLLGNRATPASSPPAGTGRPAPVGNPFNAGNSNHPATSPAGRPGSVNGGNNLSAAGAGATAHSPAPVPAAPPAKPVVPENVGSSIPRAAAQAALDLHNQARSDVGTRPLVWSAELSAFAQKWANYLATENGCRMEHRPNSGPWGSMYGENIFWGSASSFNARDAAKSWYDEIRDFRPGILTTANWYRTGHYTQMVWKSTTRVGMGQAVCPNGAMIIVGNYDPPGNYMGQSPY